MDFLRVPEARCRDQGVPGATLPAKALRFFLTFSSFLQLQDFPGWWLHNSSLSLSLRVVSSMCTSYKDICRWMYPNHPRCSHLHILNVIALTKTPFKIRLYSAVLERLGHGLILGGPPFNLLYLCWSLRIRYLLMSRHNQHQFLLPYSCEFTVNPQ